MLPGSPLALIVKRSDRRKLARELLDELLIGARVRLHKWRALTNQSAQIDTGYVAQHLVSIMTGVPGSGFRGKGDDLADHSEVKSANFLDSFDARGAVNPRWDFTVKQESELDIYLNAPNLYLAAIDLPPEQAEVVREFELRCVRSAVEFSRLPEDLWEPFESTFPLLAKLFAKNGFKRFVRLLKAAEKEGLWNCRECDSADYVDKIARRLAEAADSVLNQTQERRVRLTNACRVRIWRLSPRQHEVFRKRFEEWIRKKARSKFRRLSSRGKRQDANFQLFPPHSGTNQAFARHGSNRKGELPPVEIHLERVRGARRILHVTRDESGAYEFDEG